MVQRKVAKNKQLGIQANNTLRTEKTTNPSLQHPDSKSKGADLKAVKMKKSRSIKRANVETSLRSSAKSNQEPRQPRKPPPIVMSSPIKPSPCKSTYASPNYMKSTSSFEARKEKTTKVSSISSTSNFHRVPRTLTKTSSLEKVRTLTKAPSFKHTRTTTCSSTLKDSKFPSYLELKPGATEAEGRSVLRVCSYNHCSLNGHHHKSAPPLKRFMSSRRRLLNTQKLNRPKVFSPRKGKPSECKVKGLGERNEDFFVEIYVPDREVATQVSESLSDGPCSEIDFQDDLDLSEDTDVGPIDADHTPTPFQNQSTFESHLEVESSLDVPLDELFYGNSDIEWEDGQMFIQSDYSNDESKPDFETGNNVGKYLEEFHDYPPYFHDEIVEWICFSDVDSLPDSEFTQTGEKDIGERVMAEVKDEVNYGPDNEVPEEKPTLADEATIHATKLEDESNDEQGRIYSDLIEETTEAQNEDLDSYQNLVETASDELNEDNNITGKSSEENAAETGMEESEERSKDTQRITENLEASSAKEGISSANDEDQNGADCSEAVDEAHASRNSINDKNFHLYKDGPGQREIEANICVSAGPASFEEENDSNEAKLHSYENDVVEVKASKMGDTSRTEEDADASSATRNKMQETRKCISSNGTSDCDLELLDSCNRLKRAMRCRKEDENVEEEREFNPRGPNFLDIDPDPEAEKVDLKHQEMDDRRNAEEWMLDYALQKTVNQLTPARKKKVALLVEAFEAVLPEPKNKSYRRSLSGSTHVRPIQACN
ncbi:hypothetical protein BVRB_2g041060 [Beta vulgaris subsp. vulgaris]|uniref:uncharacterized protein LOC104887484 n=1 Tax=Beta vulgaris subsp. vulgaris TaxID=3555 RepID=UPI00053F6ECD|nr:uncharacterized protein LOC104887484 [Beta vulgaris subsp. vulgaris]KMT17045.1 hypothetical protein BVRB_2g041060 [Beta vulgaris subsp. vulgaris]